MNLICVLPLLKSNIEKLMLFRTLVFSLVVGNCSLNLDLYDRPVWLILVIVTMRLIYTCAVISGAFVSGVLRSVYCSLKANGLSLQASVSALHVFRVTSSVDG